MEEVKTEEAAVKPQVKICVAGKQHIKYVDEILTTIEESSKARGTGIARRSPDYVAYSRRLYPEAKLFGLTSGAAVLKINHELGYRPVTFEQLTDDPAFWRGCQTCVNYDVLTRTDFKRCICTAMLYDPHEHPDEVLEDLDKI